MVVVVVTVVAVVVVVSQWRLFMLLLVMDMILTAYMHAVCPSELDVRVYSITHEAGGVRIVAVDWKREVAWLI